jgi:site-specific DNA-methyltransferase (adenine-specific)
MRIECGDNLEFMKSIEDNSLDLIYCDILYGTGRKFSDYQDLKPIKSDIEEHYIPRLKEMYRILKDTGTIYLQMDTKINHWIRCIMDDIFGYDNMRNEIIWFYNTAPRKNLSLLKNR